MPLAKYLLTIGRCGRHGPRRALQLRVARNVAAQVALVVATEAVVAAATVALAADAGASPSLCSLRQLLMKILCIAPIILTRQ